MNTCNILIKRFTVVDIWINAAAAVADFAVTNGSLRQTGVVNQRVH